MPQNNLFSLTFPEGWKETSVYSFEGPEENGLKHNIVACVVPDIDKKEDVARYAKDLLQESTSELPNFEMINEDQIATADGLPVYRAVYKYSPVENVVLYQKQYYLIKDRKCYIFTGTFTRKTMRTIGRSFDTVVDSLVTYNDKNIPQ